MLQPPHLLMCPPDYYGIEYEINAWMDRRRPSNRALAIQQWEGLRQLIEGCGATVSCVEPRPGLPDLVFTANAALVHEKIAVLSAFRHPERQAEQAYYSQWFAEHGFEVRQLPPGLSFEGAGDALFCGETLIAGYRFRSHIRAHHQIAEMLGCRVIPLELVDPYFYHLDTCFCPLTPTSALYYPPAFDAYGQKVLEETIDELIAVNQIEARRFACNAVVLGRAVITNTGCPELAAQLRARGFTPCETPLDEFLKAGGAAKCLTLRLDGEDATAWKHAATSGCGIDCTCQTVPRSRPSQSKAITPKV